MSAKLSSGGLPAAGRSLRWVWALCLWTTACGHEATAPPAPPDRYDLTFDNAWGIYETRVDTVRVWPVMQDTLTSYYVSWAPDGRSVVFTREYGVSSGRYGLVIYHTIDSSEFALTPGTDEYYPAWSPDGSRIAYLSSGALHSIRPDGTGDQQLGSALYFPDPPKWSPDGRELAATRDDLEIVVVDATTGLEVRSIAPGEGLSWSPDGRHIAYATAPGLAIADTDGTNARVIPISSCRDPAWSPDGDWIAVNNGSGIQVVPANATSSTSFRFIAPYNGPAWRLRQ
ncbi:MAG TPA: hypothetical protein VMG37_02480 [Solirubrobacteraceae bacterium]|nr:hypothetical protein [Solirubrobacteraceae bacterium]